MQGTRLERDPELGEHQADFTDIETRVNTQAINCSVCNRISYTDNATYERICRSIEEGLDNPFTCESCTLECEELSIGR